MTHHQTPWHHGCHWTPWTPPWWWSCKPCFHRSTKLLMTHGSPMVPVHKIRVGDFIYTSKGDQRVLWVGKYTATDDQPIYRVKLDHRSIRVSKHHRVQIGDQLMTPHEMSKAKMGCIRVIEPQNRDMHHVLTEHHALVMSDAGIWSETLYLGGDQAPAIMGDDWSKFAHLHERHKANMARPVAEVTL